MGGNPTGPGAGWAFGRALNQGELYGVVHAVDGVEFVRILRLYETNLETGEQSAKPAGTPHRARARRADGLRPAHRQGHAPRGLSRLAEQCNGPEGTARERPRDGHEPRRRTARGNGYRTFSGAGFGTLMMQLSPGPKETPPVASTRAYLRNGLPSLYQDGDFGMRFVGALEELLDPIVAILDGAPLALRSRTSRRPTSSSCWRRGWAWTSTRRRTSSTSARWSGGRPSSAAGAGR